MAKYGLETETTVHLKGMQVDGFQSDTGGGNSYPIPTNAVFLNINSGTASVWYKEMYPSSDSIIYITGYQLNESLKGEVAVPSGTSVWFYGKDGSFTQYPMGRLCFVDEYPEDAEVLSKYGRPAFILFPR